MFKKVLVLFMVAVLLAGCGSSKETTSTTETKTDTETTETATTETTSTDTQEVAQAETVEDPVVTTEVTLVFADGDAKAKEAIYKIVDGFNGSQDAYNITIEPGVGGAYDEFLKTKESVGEFPDIVEMRDTAVYVRAGMLEPLSDDLKALFKNTSDFYGNVYTTPMAGEGTQGIIYNKKYFAEHGLNAEPKTWDEFLALCQTIKDLGDMSPIVVGGNDIWHMGFWFSKIYTDNVIAENQDFIADLYAGKATWEGNTATKQTIEDMKTLFNYVDEGWGSTPDAMVTTFLVSDMAAMLYSGTWMFTQIQEADPNFELGWFPVPDKNGKLNLVGGAGKGGWALSTEAAKDPNKKAAFDAFVRYFFDVEVYGIYLEALSLLPTTVEMPKMSVSPLLQQVNDAVNQADYISPMWNGRVGYNELPPDFRNFTYKTMVEVLSGVRTVEEALKELDATWMTSTQEFNPVTGVGF